MNYQDLFLFKIKKKKNVGYNQGSLSIYRPEAKAWICKRSSDLDYKGVFALIKIGFLQSSFYEVMWSSLVPPFVYFDWFPHPIAQYSHVEHRKPVNCLFCLYSSAEFALNIIKLLFLQKFEVFFVLYIRSLFIIIRV